MHTNVFILPGVLKIRTAQKKRGFYHAVAMALVWGFSRAMSSCCTVNDTVVFSQLS